MSHGFLTVARPCPKCGGEGQINTNPCQDCRGEGRQRAERLLSVKIPAGIEDGMQLRLTGEGPSGLNGGPAGDLYVLVRAPRARACSRATAPTSTATCRVSFPQLALGAELEVPVLGGTAKLKVPGGSQPGQVLRLRGKRHAAPARARATAMPAIACCSRCRHKLNAKQREALEAFEEASKERGPLAHRRSSSA